ncbi:MAG: SDR family oxidoreductase, partial [Chloroflexota bacterium]
MKILVIGGTRFVGRHFVDAALANGHKITLFNRGQSNADLYPGVENLRGDRTVDLSALDGRSWDVVVDTCGYVPRIVRMSAEKLANAVDRYLFISTISVYDVLKARDMDEENSPLLTLEDPTVEEITGETYGGLKVLCEQAVEAVFPGRALQVRPGMIIGPHDPTDRYTYWVVRAAQGSEILVPGTPERPVQMIDGRDLGAGMLRMIEDGTTGIFNATGPEHPLTWRAWMQSCADAAGTQPTFTYLSDEFLTEHEVNGGDLPFWVSAEYENIFAVSVERAKNAGMSFRPSAESGRDTLAWRGAADVTALKVGLKPEREAELLAAWHQQEES